VEKRAGGQGRPGTTTQADLSLKVERVELFKLWIRKRGEHVQKKAEESPGVLLAVDSERNACRRYRLRQQSKEEIRPVRPSCVSFEILQVK